MRSSLCFAPVAEPVRIEINQQVTAGLFARVLSDADVIGGSELLGIRNAGKLRRAPISLCVIQSGLNTIHEIALIERL